MTKLFVLLAIMDHSNGTPLDVFVVDDALTYENCIYAQEGLEPIVAANVVLTCKVDLNAK